MKLIDIKKSNKMLSMTTNRISIGTRIDEFELKEAERHELSALLLSHCLLYKSSLICVLVLLPC
jgi:hypothetical protein